MFNCKNKSIALVFVFQFVTTLALLISQDDLSDFDQPWQDHADSGPISRLISELSSLCERRQQIINFTAMEIEVESCISPLAKQLLEPIELNGEAKAIEVQDLKATLLTGEFVHLRRVVVKRVCEFAPALINCIEPVLEQTEECSSNPALEKLILKYSGVFVGSLCKEDGNKLLEFLEDGGSSCASSYVSQNVECFSNKSQNFLDKEGELVEQTVESFCGKLNDVNQCFYDNLKLCPVNSSATILNSILGEVSQWTSIDCSKSSAVAVAYGKFMDGLNIAFVLLSVSLISKSWHE